MLALLSGDFFAPNAKPYSLSNSKIAAEPPKLLALTTLIKVYNNNL